MHEPDQPPNPPALLRAWVKGGDESAFAALVEHFAALVYGTALRVTHGRHDLAPDISQRVFCDLARRAPALLHERHLDLWLHRRTRWAAADVMKSERRRTRRETKAAMNLEELPLDGFQWHEWAPHLDAALAELPKPDRLAVVMRHLQHRRFSEIASTLGSSEEAARKRTSRALEKLRPLLAKRGVTMGTTVLASMLAAESARALPSGLAAQWSTAAVGSKLGTIGTLTLKAAAPAASALLGVALAAGGLQVASLANPASTAETAAPSTPVMNSTSPPSAPETRDQPPTLSEDEFIEALARLMRDPPGSLREARARALFDQLEPGAGTALAGRLISRIDRPQLDSIVDLFHRYVRREPAGAVFRTLAEQWPPGFQRDSRLSVAMGRWVLKEPANAIDWLEGSLANGQLRKISATAESYRKLRSQLLDLAANGIERQQGSLTSLEFQVDRTNAGEIVEPPDVTPGEDVEERNAQFALLAQIESAPLRHEAQIRYVAHLGRIDPGAGRALVDALEDAETRAVISHRACLSRLNRFAQSPPEDTGALIDWALRHAPPNTRPYVAADLVGLWLDRADDFTTPRRWLRAQSDFANPETEARMRERFRILHLPASEEAREILREAGIQLQSSTKP